MRSKGNCNQDLSFWTSFFIVLNLMLFYICILYFLLVFIYLNFTFLVLRSYCNAQLKIYSDNCTIEINKIIIIIIITIIIVRISGGL